MGCIVEMCIRDSANIMHEPPVRSGTLFERGLIRRVILHGLFIAGSTMAAYPVSYTHLDVYKRQGDLLRQSQHPAARIIMIGHSTADHFDGNVVKASVIQKAPGNLRARLSFLRIQCLVFLIDMADTPLGPAHDCHPHQN